MRNEVKLLIACSHLALPVEVPVEIPMELPLAVPGVNAKNRQCQFPPVELLWYCRGTAVVLPWHFQCTVIFQPNGAGQ